MSEWISDDPIHAPADGITVWIAYQEVKEKDPKKGKVAWGYFDKYYRKWRFSDGAALSEKGFHALGWLPVDAPSFP